MLNIFLHEKHAYDYSSSAVSNSCYIFCLSTAMMHNDFSDSDYSDDVTSC